MPAIHRTSSSHRAMPTAAWGRGRKHAAATEPHSGMRRLYGSQRSGGDAQARALQAACDVAELAAGRGRGRVRHALCSHPQPFAAQQVRRTGPTCRTSTPSLLGGYSRLACTAACMLCTHAPQGPGSNGACARASAPGANAARGFGGCPSSSLNVITVRCFRLQGARPPRPGEGHRFG